MSFSSSHPFQEHQITHLPLSESDRQFLLTVGLPLNGIPFLSFRNPPESHLTSIPAKWGLPESLRQSLAAYYEFGYDGGGNPLCFDTNDSCKIVWLNHEDSFRSVWVNDHITEFAGCLAALQDAFDGFEAAGGDTDALWDEGFEPERYEQLTATFASIDEKTLTHGFWPYTIDDFRPR
jgi:SUKH-4 immunity protein